MIWIYRALASPGCYPKILGVHHYAVKEPRNPRPNAPVWLEVTTSQEKPIQFVTLWYTTDEWETNHELRFEKHSLVWDTLLWEYLQHWWVQLPEQPHDTMLRYRIAAFDCAAAQWVFADNQAHTLSEGTNFSVWYSDEKAADFYRQAIVYQVFPDRFNPGEGRQWIQTKSLMEPNGGSLKGVIEKLDHIQSLGFDTIWLTPIFDSPSHHGYDTCDYYSINPRMGSDQDFEELVSKVHARGMKLILDFVANHCSDKLPQFIDAQKNEVSPYHDWFTWSKWPGDYQCFYDVRNMPELDLRYGKPARTYLLECAQYWLKRGADGYRLDYAHGPAQDFWVDFRRACQEAKPGCWIFGEINRPADATATFAGGLDGALDFHLCRMLRLTFAQQTWSLSQFASALQAHFAYFDKDFHLPAFIDNHDMNRFLVPAHADERLLKIALMLLYFLPGQPIVYYGTEFPLGQHRSIHGEQGLGFDEARLPVDWEKEQKISCYLETLATFRKAHPEITNRQIEILQCDDLQDYLVLHTGSPQKGVWLLINRSEQIREVSFHAAGNQTLIDGLTGDDYDNTGDFFKIALNPVSSIVLVSA